MKQKCYFTSFDFFCQKNSEFKFFHFFLLYFIFLRKTINWLSRGVSIFISFLNNNGSEVLVIKRERLMPFDSHFSLVEKVLKNKDEKRN